MALIRANTSGGGGGGSTIDFKYDTANKGAGKYTYHTKNAWAMISSLTHCQGAVVDGAFTSIYDAYHSVFNMAYDATTETLTLNLTDSRSVAVVYDDLG